MLKHNRINTFSLVVLWVRHDLEIFPKKTEGVRRVYAQGNSPVFTESQMQVSERRKLEKQVEGEIETKTSRIFRTPKYV